MAELDDPQSDHVRHNALSRTPTTIGESERCSLVFSEWSGSLDRRKRFADVLRGVAGNGDRNC